MQGGQNWILQKCKCRLVLLSLSLARNLGKPVMSLIGTEWKERGFRLQATGSGLFCRSSFLKVLSSEMDPVEIRLIQ
jgi:hypothetical protein